MTEPSKDKQAKKYFWVCLAAFLLSFPLSWVLNRFNMGLPFHTVSGLAVLLSYFGFEVWHRSSAIRLGNKKGR